MLEMGFDPEDVEVIRSIYKDAYYAAETSYGRTTNIPLTRGTKQGNVLSPCIFGICISALLKMLEKLAPEKFGTDL